jgi:methyltransferase (TIGR00027 family)
MNRPSVTSQVVALTRSGFDRPHSPDGDPDAQRSLCEGMRITPPAWLGPSIAARTRFVDERVLAAIAAGIRQVVICGAGYDDRALRFRTAGVRFFELDHPATQQDKAARLAALGAGEPAVTLAAADFTTDDVAAVLATAGHDAGQPTLFVCEGLLVYLEAGTCQRLLAGLVSRAAAGSVLAVSLATHAEGFDPAEVVAAANARRITGAAEPWRTILPPAGHADLLARAGWSVIASEPSPGAPAEEGFGRRSLLATAVPASPAAADGGRATGLPPAAHSGVPAATQP